MFKVARKFLLRKQLKNYEFIQDNSVLHLKDEVKNEQEAIQYEVL